MSITEADQFKNYAGRQQTRDIPADQELTQVGPDTLCGEYLRRFWQPVILSSELGDLPKTVRILGEDLVLFRTKKGEIGLLDKHCCHRGTSLEYGIITDEGISCCYHGWHYAVDGTILETPNDPKSRIKDELRSTAYPTHEFKNIIFAYMGPPETVPEFPLLDTLVDAETDYIPYSLLYPCNWLQVLENTQDPVHSVFLHTRVSGVQFHESWGALPVVEWVRTPLGMMNINVRRWGDNVWVRTTESIMANMNQFGGLWESAEKEKYFHRVSNTRWMRPIDDTHMEMIGWRYINKQVDPDGRSDRSKIGHGRTDVMGHTEEERPYEERQRHPGDFEAMMSQGSVTIHALENLNATDTGVAMLRTLLRRGMNAVAEGKRFITPPRDSSKIIPTFAQDTVLKLPPRGENDETLIRAVGKKVAEIIIDSAKIASEIRQEEIERRIKAIKF
jgi:phenylpropionate dioxygenase-like ring-hydroxylating dioxygenase large terminal subunit